MTIWSRATGWRRSCLTLFILTWSLSPSFAEAASNSGASSNGLEVNVRQFAALHTPSRVPPDRPSVDGRGKLPQEHVAESRQVLLELQVFIEAATSTLELGERLKRQRRANHRLRQSLSSTRAAKSTVENRNRPMAAAIDSLTATIVGNWLETVRLKHRSDRVDRSLLASERSRLALESHAETLERTLIERRKTLLALQARRDRLGEAIGELRRQIADADKETRRLIREKKEVVAATGSLRREITSALRAILLEGGVH